MWSKYCIRKGKLFNLVTLLRTNDVAVYFRMYVHVDR